MKKLLAAMFVALLMVGCGGDGKSGSDSSESNQSSAETPEAKTAQDDKINLDDNEILDKIIAEAIDIEKLQRRGKEGEGIWYYEQTPYSGWMKMMYDNGQMSRLLQYKDGKLDGPATMWYSNGQKRGEYTYMDGKLWTAVAWKPNGEKCPVTNVVNGNGVLVEYRDDGTEDFRATFKDGSTAQEIAVQEVAAKEAALNAPAVFKDTKLEGRVRFALGKGEGNITREDIASLELLNAQLALAPVTDLSGLEHANKLIWLYLDFNQITDVTPLAGLMNLKVLKLDHNKISDLTPLAGLKNLEYLLLHHNEITDLSPLKGLTGLKTMDLGGNPISEEQKATLKKALPNCKIKF